MTEAAAPTPSFIGIDVSKSRLDVHARPAGTAFSVGRDPEGLSDLVKRLLSLKPTVVVIEATGGFEITVAAALSASKLPLAIINGCQIRDFACARRQLAKTDTLNAKAIALPAERKCRVFHRMMAATSRLRPEARCCWGRLSLPRSGEALN